MLHDYGMVITNNSYGDIVGDCDYMGYYDLQSRVLDQMAIDLPNLQNVFAAGNDGGLTCLNYPSVISNSVERISICKKCFNGWCY